MRRFFCTAGLAAALCLSSVANAQDQSEINRVTEIASRLEQLMSQLSERGAEYPTFIEELQQGLVTIDQADAQVEELIDQLRTATAEMEDSRDLDTAIDDYKTAVTDLIGEAEASNNDAMKSAIPDLEETLASLEASDEQRAATVVEARNLIRSLEQDREAISFFIRANQTQRAASLISSNIDEFVAIVENGQALAMSLMGTVQP